MKSDAHASEFKIEGYVIEIYDEKKYDRDKDYTRKPKHRLLDI